MAELRAVARVDEVPPDSVRAIDLDGTTVALARVGDEFHALAGHCAHMGGPLGEGALEGCVLSCPWHGWQYDVRTGENEFDRAIRVETYPVRVEDGVVSIQL